MIEQAILIGLAGWRIASLLVNEDGPWAVFERLRQFIGIKEGPIEGFLPQLFSCVWCLSIWTVLFCYFLWQIEPVSVILLAAAAIAVVVEKFTNG